MLMTRRHRFALAILASVLGASVALPAALDEVARLFRAGQYDQARALGPGALSTGRDGEAALWNLQLANEPRLALRVAREVVQDDDLPPAVRVRAALDAATIALAQDRPAAALEFLQPLVGDQRLRALVPAEVHVLAGTAARALRMQAEARRYLEQASAADPAYGAAQYQLGRLALDLGEYKRAADAFQTASAAAGGSDLLADAGRWQALRRLGRAAEAQAVAQRVLKRSPSSLAAMEIRTTLHREGGAASGPLPPDLPAGDAAADGAAGLTVELARFGDRAAALVYVAQLRGVIGDLEVVDDGGGYAVLKGRYASREEAERAVENLRDTHDLRGRVVEREGR